jgi:cysteine desulfurase / selenocysteine lyase
MFPGDIMPASFSERDFRSLVSGFDAQVPLLQGTSKRYVNLDNAASTPSFFAVKSAVNEFLDYYSSVHRGTGFKSQLSTHLYEAARETVMRFVGADPREHTCIFSKNTTESLNKLANRYPFKKERDIVLVSAMEHHSNDLPWRSAAKVVHINLTREGRLDENDFDEKLEQFADRLALVAITGASNVTGFLNPIHRLAQKTHAAGAEIVVDCAQLAPHRAVRMLSLSDSAHLDYVAISAHKMYAPFGAGALVGKRSTFEQGDPDMRGGGTVEIVTLEDVVWAGPPERDEAGSPNVVGAVALAAAIHQLEEIGLEQVADHEAELTAYALERLSSIPGLQIYGDLNPAAARDRLGVIPLEVKGKSHFLVSSILGYEFGIGVRSGCFCAHPYILHLLGLSAEQALEVRSAMISGNKADMPGLIRASFGIYNTQEDVDELIEALTCITEGKYGGEYIQDRASGEYMPKGWQPDFDQYVSFSHSSS